MTLIDSSLFSSFSIHNTSVAYSPTPAISRSCLACRIQHKSCDRGKPCSRCISRGIAHLCCEPSTKKRGRPRKWKDGDKNENNDNNNHEHTSATLLVGAQPTTDNAVVSQSSPTSIITFTNNSVNLASEESNIYDNVSSPSSGISSPTTTTLVYNTAVPLPIMKNVAKPLHGMIDKTTTTTTTTNTTTHACKSPSEEALLTETLKKTQSKKLKFIKIMNYNPNHRETFSPKFTITSLQKNIESLKHNTNSSSTLHENVLSEPSTKKRKIKSTTANNQSTIVSTPTSNFAMTYQTSTVQSHHEYNVQQISSPGSVPFQYSTSSPINTFTQQSQFPNYNSFQYPQFYQSLLPNQPRHCDEDQYVSHNQNVKLPSIYSLLSSLQE